MYFARRNLTIITSTRGSSGTIGTPQISTVEAVEESPAASVMAFCKYSTLNLARASRSAGVKASTRGEDIGEEFVVSVNSQFGISGDP